MSVSVGEVVNSFSYLYASLWRKEFTKTLRPGEYSERELLPLLRFYLLGWFGDKVSPEVPGILPGALRGSGRLDFLIGDVAVEFAVRRRDDRACTLRPEYQATEVKKLLKYDGKGVLILFDLSYSPLTLSVIREYRSLPAMGNHIKTSFHVAYFYRNENGETDHIRRHVRIFRK